MTEIIRDFQKQYPGSNLVTLYELELPSGSILYFHDGTQANTADVTFDGHTYDAIPAMVEGIEVSSEGAAARPTLTIANVLTVFKDALGASYTYDDLLGKKFTRRRTLSAYLASSPAVEYPKDIYYIDRISEKTIISVTFELASPFDLEGVTLPARIIMGGGCPWKYQGANPDLAESSKDGGCSWRRGSGIVVSGTLYTNYVNVNDEPVVINTSVVGAFSGTGTKGNIYSTSQSGLVKIEANGQFTYSQSSNNYWQCLVNTSNTPSDANSSEWRRVRTYSVYSNTTTYNVYTDPSYNDYVTNTADIPGTILYEEKFDSITLADLQSQWNQTIDTGGDESLIVETTNPPTLYGSGRVWQLGNNSGDDEVSRSTGKTWSFPLLDNVMYKITIYLRRAAGSGTCYFGVVGLAADRITLVNTAGAATYSSQWYFGASSYSPPDTAWFTSTGYFKANSVSGNTGSGINNRTSYALPGQLLSTTVKYFTPAFFTNYDNQAGIWQIGYIKLEVLPNELFKKRWKSQANTATGADPGYNDHWEIGDSCGKRLYSCTRRFQFRPGTSNGQTVPNTVYDQTIILPFGGFPGSRTYQ